MLPSVFYSSSPCAGWRQSHGTAKLITVRLCCTHFIPGELIGTVLKAIRGAKHYKIYRSAACAMCTFPLPPPAHNKRETYCVCTRIYIYTQHRGFAILSTKQSKRINAWPVFTVRVTIVFSLFHICPVVCYHSFSRCGSHPLWCIRSCGGYNAYFYGVQGIRLCLNAYRSFTYSSGGHSEL